MFGVGGRVSQTGFVAGWALAPVAALLAALSAAPLAQAQSTPATAPAQAATAPAPAASAGAQASTGAQSIQIQGQRLRNAAGKLTLNREELARIPGSSGDPMKAVQTLPGVATVDDSSAAPAVRGARPQDNLYYVDFLPVGYLFHLGGFASTFHPDLIRRFDLASAAWSPEYGDAVGAIFDISLRNPRTDRLGGQLDFSLLGASVLVEGPLNDRLSFFLAGRRSWFDLVVKTVEDKEEGVTVTVPVFHDSQGRLLWTLSTDHRLRLDFSTAGDKIDFSTRAGSKAVQRDPVLVGNSNLRQAYRSLAVSWDGEWSPRVSQQMALGQMKQLDLVRLGAAGQLEAMTTTTYLRDQVRVKWAPDHQTTMGSALNSQAVALNVDLLDGRCTEFDPNCDISTAPRVATVQNTRRNLTEAYASHRWQINPAFTATGGLRASRDGGLGRTEWEPRLGLEWNWSSQTQLSLGLGRHNQAAPPDQTLPVVGNPALAHLRSTHQALGITQSLAQGWSWRAEAYTKRFTGYALVDPLLAYRNGGSGSAQGLELLVKKEGITSKLTGFFSLSISRSQRRNDSTGETFRFEYDQPVIANLVGQYKLSNAWILGAKWSYHTGAPTTPVVGTGFFPDGRVRPIYGAINSQRVPSYHRLDLRVDHPFSPHLTGYAEIINAYARKNVAGYSYSPDYKTREAVYQLPLLPSIGVKYAF